MLPEAAGIAVDGLFLHTGSAFDTHELRQACATRGTEWQTDDDTFFDPELYRRRAVAEHANAWLDSFTTLLVRDETSIGNWLAFHWLEFIVLFLRKINAKPTS